ncbi:MAG TPA: hypothetical protein ENG51_17870, partial [Deltaproteobacteria bacterium]|nr:hypothetical protein [Deltaproteobacteria bacterium]
WMRGPEEVALYKVAYQTASLIPFGLMAVNTAIAPSLSQLGTSGDKSRMRRLVLLATGVSLTFALPFLFIFIGGGPWLIEWLFGKEFLPAAKPLIILTVASLVQISTGPLWQMLLMTGYEKSVAFITAIGAGMYLVANALLVPLWGPQGAAVAMLTYFISISGFIFLFVYIRKVI